MSRQGLVNRVAALAMLATLLAMVGTVAAATAFERSRSAAVRAASTSPLLAAAGVALWARSARAQLRRADAEEPAGGAAPESPGAGTDVVEEERRASTDLRAIDAVVRAFHRARAAAERPAALAPAARLDLRDGGGRGYAERSRTVHVLGDFAVVITAYEVDRPDGGARGVAFLQLRLEPGGWRVDHAVSRSVDRAITERLADPRPLRRQA